MSTEKEDMAQTGRKYFPKMYLINKGLLSKIYKELLKFTVRKQTTLLKYKPKTLTDTSPR